jgi:hypothetical protein
MSLFPFQGSQTGNLVEYKIQIAPQATANIPAVSGFSDSRVYGFPASPTPGNIDAMRLNNTIDPLPRLIGKTDFAPFGPMLCGDFDPANVLQNNALVNCIGKYTESNPVAGVTRRIISALGATTASQYNTMKVDDNADFRLRYHTCVVSGLHFSASPNGNLQLVVDWAKPNGFDWHGAVSQEVGAGSTLPVMAGTWTGTKTLGFSGEGQWAADATDRDIYIKIVTVSGSDITLKAKYSAAATYDGDAVSYTMGTYPGAALRNQINERFGRVADHVRAYWAAGSTLAPNDEFKVLKRAAAWTPSYATEYSIPSVNAKFYDASNSNLVATEGGWAIDIVRDGLIHTDDVFGLQSGSTLKAGQLIAKARPTRTITDLTLQRALHSRQKLNVVFDFESDSNIGVTAYPFRAILALLNCDVEGTSFIVDGGAKNRNEVVTLTASLPTAGITYDGIALPAAAFSILLDNAVATL